MTEKKILIRQADSDSELRCVAEMADPIWHEAFAGIISREQIEYMVEKFQSYGAIRKQVADNGYRYFILSYDGKDAGYCGVQVCEDNTLYLSKMYLKKGFRGCGLFNAMTDFLKDLCTREGIKSIWLTVNKHNDRAIAAYKKNGYENIRSQVSDIGCGYVMDDYVFQLRVEKE